MQVAIFTPAEVRHAMFMINMAASHDGQPEIKIKDVNAIEIQLALALHNIVDKLADNCSDIEDPMDRIAYLERILKQLEN